MGRKFLKSNNNQHDNLRLIYDQHAQTRETSDLKDWKIKVRASFLAVLRQEQKQSLLEIGAGTGRDSLFFREQGLDVVCIDLSSAMVTLCRQKGLDGRVMDITELQFPDGSFDAIYAMNSLLHLAKSELPTALGEMDRVLKPGGLAFVGLFGGFDHEGVWERDTYWPKRFYSFYTDSRLEEELTRVFDLHSFNQVFFEPDPDPNAFFPAELAMHFQAVILKKRSPGNPNKVLQPFDPPGPPVL